MAVNFEALRKMSNEQLRELNDGICQVIRERNADRARSEMSKFSRGDTARFFSSKRGRHVTVRIDKFNTKSVSCTELDSDMKPTVFTWRVHPSLLQAMH